MLPTWAMFIAAFPQFTNTPYGQALFASLMTWLPADVNAAVFGPDYTRALELLAAHWFVLTARDGNGAITSDHVGDLSRSYQAMDTKATLNSTSWGQMFRVLARRKVGTLHFVGQRYPAHLGNYPPAP